MGILRFPWKSSAETSDPVIGILAFEVAGLMSKMVNLWHSLSDKEVMWLREQIADSAGVKRFVSEDEDYLMDLALEEIIKSFGSLSRSVARLSKKCRDPVYHQLERFYDDPAQNDLQWFGWSYKWKKMERKVKKMERFVGAAMQLSHEQDVLVELEQTLRRMQVNNAQFDRVKLLEFQQKVMWQRQEVKNLRGASPWGKTHDYVVRLMARSLFTVLERIKLVFGGVDRAGGPEEGKDFCKRRNSDFLPRADSFSPIAHSSVHPSETQRTRREKFRHSKSKRHGGSFSGCMVSGSRSPIVEFCDPAVGGSMRLVPTYVKSKESARKSSQRPVSSSNNKIYSKLALFNSKSKSLNLRSNTLGDAALALQYANVIKLIEKLASSPHLIGPDARDDVYNMLPTSIKSALRAKLKSYAKTMGSYVYNPGLAAQWNTALVQILEWLAPLAHNTIRWHSERNIETQNELARTNVLLVQTLYHANQAKTEAAITELLLGLNYICRISGVDETAMMRERASSLHYLTAGEHIEEFPDEMCTAIRNTRANECSALFSGHGKR